MSRRSRKKRPAPPAPTKHRGLLENDWLVSALLLLGLLAVYNINGDFLPGNDSAANAFLPLNLLERGRLTFTATDWPTLFQDAGRDTGDPAGPPAAPTPKYILVSSIRTDPASGERLFVNTYGIGAGLSALPIMAALRLVAGDLRRHPAVLWYGAKFTASLLVAASAALVYLIGREFLGRRWALLVAVSYGLGTCVWSSSSQALWQHGPNEFFLMLGTYLFLRRSRSPWYLAASAAAYGWAVLCRPTSALVAVAVAAYLLATAWRSALLFCLAGSPLALALAGYNAYFLGSPFAFGQTEMARTSAPVTAGSPGVWQTPLWIGAAGQLLSPSRGLLVFSPFVIFAVAGGYLVWRDRRFADLRPLTIAALSMLLVEAKHFDWWGGWSYGYRRIVDPAALLVLSAIPIIPRIDRRRWALATYLVLLAWSIYVQYLGAFAYDVVGWNARLAGIEFVIPGRDRPVLVDPVSARRLIGEQKARPIREVRQDIDSREYRSRLWSLWDNQIAYYIGNFAESRRTKHRLIRAAIEESLNLRPGPTGAPGPEK